MKIYRIAQDDFVKMDEQYKGAYDYAEKNWLPQDSKEFQTISQMSEQLWQKALDGLPSIKNGYTRLLHQTGSLEGVRSIRKSGLRFNNGLTYTTYATKDMNEFYVAGKLNATSINGTRVYSVEDGNSVVFDVPDNIYRELCDLRNGVVPSQYYVGFVPARAAIVREEGNVLLPSQRMKI